MSSFNFKLAFRNLIKAKMYTGINIIGLSVGIAAVILIYRIISFELSFNKSFIHYDRIVRVASEIDIKSSGVKEYGAGMALPVMELLKKDVPQFIETSKISETWPTISVPNENGGAPLKKFISRDDMHPYYVEPSFFDIFDYRWIEGKPNTSLVDVNTIVLTRMLAEKCFGSAQAAMSKYISLDNKQPYLRVDGVIEDIPITVDLQANAFISYLTYTKSQYYDRNNTWSSVSSNNQFYALLENNTTLEKTNSILANIGQDHYKGDRIAIKHVAQPLSDIHYNAEIGDAGTHPMNKNKLLILGLIGVMILVMACFNFINMANAQSVSRLKEVGIRKTLGVGNGQLMAGFLFETSILVGLSIVGGLGIAYLTIPYLHHISHLPSDIHLIDTWSIVWVLILLWILVTVFAGLYPATVLTSFQPVKIFRSDYDRGWGSGTMLRKTLVVFQFVIAFGLIISTVIVLRQLSYIKNMSLGFDKDLIYTFDFNGDSITYPKLKPFCESVKRIPGVQHISISSDKPSSNNTWSSNWRLNIAKEDAPFEISIKFCDEEYLNTYGLKLLAGRWIGQYDTMREAVLNRTALTMMGVTDIQSVIGTRMRLGSHDLDLVGVVEDYQSHSAHEPLEALIMTSKKDNFSLINLKLNTDDVHSTIPKIQSLYDQYFPEQVFNGAFLDDDLQKYYKEDNQFSASIKGFALLAVIISCLGLFALASFTISRRTKEIGIRKVLGATTQSVVNLISKDFLILVLLAFMLAAPLSYYLMHQWLLDFVYRTQIFWWMFAIAVVLVAGIAFLTVAVQAIRAAWTNPVKSLRSE